MLCLTFFSIRHLVQPDIPTSIIGVLGIIAGFLLSMFGLKLMKPTLFISGYVFMMLVGIVLLARLEPSGGYQNAEVIIMAGSSAMGVVGGLIALAYFRVGMTMLGATTGSLFAMFTLTFSPDSALNTDVSRMIYIFAFGGIGAVLVHFAEAYMVMFTTAMMGAYIFIASIDIFAQTGLFSEFTNLLTGQSHFSEVSHDTHLMLMLFAMMAMAMVGMAVQYRIYSRDNAKGESDESPRRGNGIFMSFDFRGQQRRRTFYKKTSKQSNSENIIKSNNTNAPIAF